MITRAALAVVGVGTAFPLAALFDPRSLSASARAVAVAVALLAGADVARAQNAGMAKHGHGAATAGDARFSVALVGDSILEGGMLPDPRRQGIPARLRAALDAAGFDTGDEGFVPAHPALLTRFTRRARPGWPIRYAGTWVHRTEYGPSRDATLLSLARGAGARASLATHADAVAVLYLTGPRAGRFTIATGPRRVTVDARAPRPGGAMTWVRLPAGARHVEVVSGDSGVGLVGMFARDDPRVGARQVEVSTLAQGGIDAANPLGPVQRAAFAALRPDLTVLMLGTNDALGAPRDVGRFERGLRAWASRARNAGACAVVPPGTSVVAPRVADRFAASARAVARDAGCAYAPVLRALTDGPVPSTPLTTDGIHPTAAGASAVAARLAPLVVGHLGPPSA